MGGGNKRREKKGRGMNEGEGERGERKLGGR